MLLQKQFEQLYEVITPRKESQIHSAMKQFKEYFGNDPIEYYKPCYCLISCIQDNLLDISSRIVALYILVDSYQSDSFATQNPFSINILDLFNQITDYEKQFLENLILNKARDTYYKLTINQFTEQYQKYNQKFDNYEAIKKLRKNILEQAPKKVGMISCDINSTISDFNKKDKQSYPPKKNLNFNKIPESQFELAGFCPDFARPIPVPLELDTEECEWMNPGTFQDVQWNYNNDTNQLALVKELMQKAYSIQLSQDELKFLQEALQSDQKIVDKCGITPEKLPDLVDKNVQIASTILTQLNNMKSDSINQYYEVIINMELNLYSLEVVNNLVQNVQNQVPQEFLNYYICNCIQQCEEYKKDKNNQNRLVRLVCVFIKSMIKQKIVNPADMYIELQAFCIEFSKVSEASQLFKMLKGLQPQKDNK